MFGVKIIFFSGEFSGSYLEGFPHFLKIFNPIEINETLK